MTEKTVNTCPLCGEPTDLPKNIPHNNCATEENLLDEMFVSTKLARITNAGGRREEPRRAVCVGNVDH